MWDFDFQGVQVNPLNWNPLEFAAFANAASSEYGVMITADDVTVMTGDQRVAYLQTLDEFLDGVYTASYSQGSDQNSYYTDYADAAPLGMDFIETYGWMPHVQQMAGYQYYNYLTQDIDPEFLEAISDANYQNY